jgi:hypothetical protein
MCLGKHEKSLNSECPEEEDTCVSSYVPVLKSLYTDFSELLHYYTRARAHTHTHTHRVTGLSGPQFAAATDRYAPTSRHRHQHLPRKAAPRLHARMRRVGQI